MYVLFLGAAAVRTLPNINCFTSDMGSISSKQLYMTLAVPTSMLYVCQFILLILSD